MDFNTIIEQIYNDPQLQILSRTVAKQDNEDLLHEVICQLYDKPEKVQEVYNKGYLKLYVARMLIWQKNDKYSLFNKKYNQPFSPWDDETYDVAEEIIDHEGINRREIRALKKVLVDSQQAPPHFYPARLCVEVSECKSFREASRRTGIPLKSVIYTFRKYVKEVRAYAEQD
jgi:DNA-directed RNA polymerase specialized sigma24 family protein